MFKKSCFILCDTLENGGRFLMDFAGSDKVVTETIDIVTKNVVKYMIINGKTVSTAESCTGGMIAECITRVPGASGCFPGGVCSYSEKVKQKVLGVKGETLAEYTVYSPQVASEMSAGAMELFETDYAIGVTGLAGPDGGTEDKPVGTVYVSVRSREREIVRDLKLYEECEELTRELIRQMTTLKAMEMLGELAEL